MKKARSHRLGLGVFACAVGFASLAVVAACTDDNAIHENTPQDAGKADSGQDGGTVVITGDSGIAVDCFEGDAQTYEEIINACTPATKVDKHPTLPLLLADGGLPPLP